MKKKKRVRNHKQRGMHRRKILGKKPMSLEQKEVQKKAREAQRKVTRDALVKMKTMAKVEN